MIYILLAFGLLQIIILSYLVFTSYGLIEYIKDQFENRLISTPKPKLIERTCQFCGEKLIAGTEKTRDGYWACGTCRITKLNQRFN